MLPAGIDMLLSSLCKRSVTVPGYAGQIGNHVEEVLLGHFAETWVLWEGDDRGTIAAPPSYGIKNTSRRCELQTNTAASAANGRLDDEEEWPKNMLLHEKTTDGDIELEDMIDGRTEGRIDR